MEHLKGIIKKFCIYETLARKRPIDDSSPTQLAKVLTTFDLTALGVGSTLGVGVYVLAGEVAKTVAGPAVNISFLIAAIVSVLAGLCYAEFAARVPRAGSAYVYCYVTIGEFIAFLIGWNLILEYSIGSASIVKALSTNINSFVDFYSYLNETMPLHISGLSPFPDLFAFVITMVFSLALAFGVKESTLANNIFTTVNILVVLFVIIAGSFRADLSNWNIPAKRVRAECGNNGDCGTGGFLPFGIKGVLKGSATCFFAFVGFDGVTTASEEAKDPKRSIPIAIIVSLFIVFIAYFGISTILTMMLPYYLQNVDTPLASAFQHYGWKWAEIIVSVGCSFGLCASLIGCMFPLPRIIYAMASDGLIFKWMGRINERFQTPVYGTLFVGTLTGLMATFLSLRELVNMMSIGTLLAYMIVAACVMLLRYEVDDNNRSIENSSAKPNFFRDLWNSNCTRTPNDRTAAIVTAEVTAFCLVSVLFVSFIKLETVIQDFIWWTIFSVIVAILISILLLISRQPTRNKGDSFEVPLTPWLPGISIIVNFYLMLQLDYLTWIRFVVWVTLGLLVYFSYGIRNSAQRYQNKNHLNRN